MFSIIKFSPKLAFFGIVSAAVSMGFTASPAHANVMFSIDGISLNTNNNFRKIDGHPRMSIYRSNDKDPDQQFEIIGGNHGGVLLKNRTTGKCLNAHYLSAGSEINVWPCNPSDVDQNFLLTTRDGFTQIKRVRTNLCVDTPTRNNEGRVTLWHCELNNANQRWRMQSTSPNNPSNSWKLPWAAGISTRLTQRWHTDGWGLNGLDFGLSAGTPVLAPFDSEVLSFCNAGNNHLAIRLRATDGQIYSLIHVTSTGVTRGRRYRQGEQIGVIAGEGRNNRLNPGCAKTTGPHLHFGLPNRNFRIDDYNFTPTNIPTNVTSKNR
jgi:murein DD-endopeptidase MepM/ murein hydrolase activator NlpD